MRSCDAIDMPHSTCLSAAASSCCETFVWGSVPGGEMWRMVSGGVSLPRSVHPWGQTLPTLCSISHREKFSEYHSVFL